MKCEVQAKGCLNTSACIPNTLQQFLLANFCGELNEEMLITPIIFGFYLECRIALTASDLSRDFHRPHQNNK